jgi:hypothetical protein
LFCCCLLLIFIRADPSSFSILTLQEAPKPSLWVTPRSTETLKKFPTALGAASR